MTFRAEIEAELESLLQGDETVPDIVRRGAQRLDEFGIWHQFSRNEPATSCQDAARKRNRLGHKGIPLWDELKSFLGECHDAQGTRKIFLAHCRGDRRLDLDKLRKALGFEGEIGRVFLKTEERLWAEHRVGYGTVNPLTDVAGVVQIFDVELKHPVGEPSTVMTNAGDFTWAVEFEPAELVRTLPGALWANIVQAEIEDEIKIRWGVRERETIGILTGNPPDSGWELAATVDTHIRHLLKKNSLGDVSMPKIVVLSTPKIGISMEMDRREAPLRRALLEAVDELCTLRVRILAHPAHTTHYFAADIAARATEKGARFLSMSEIIASKLRSMRIEEIALLGTKYVTDFSQQWSVYTNAFEDLRFIRRPRQGGKKFTILAMKFSKTDPHRSASIGCAICFETRCRHLASMLFWL